MSELEKRRRDRYRQNRSKWIMALSAALAVLILLTVIFSATYIRITNAYYVNYTETSDVDYRVSLKKNDFYQTPTLGSDMTYIASLIDSVVANFVYQLHTDADDVNYEYSYGVEAQIHIVDNKSKEEIFNPKYVLKDEQRLMQNTNNQLKISEIVMIDYEYYNDLANRFVEEYDIKSSTTNTLEVRLNVKVHSSCAALKDQTVNNHVVSLSFPLTDKTVDVKMLSGIPESETKTIACDGGASKEVFRVTAIVFGVLDGLLALFMVAFIFLTRTKDIAYAGTVQKILSRYKSYIQKINNSFEMEGYQVLHVNTFNEMLEIRETIQEPILMYENDDKTRSEFVIPTNTMLLYVFIVRVEDFDRDRQKEEPVAQPVMIEIVEEPVVEEIVEEPVIEEPVVEEIVEEPVIEEPVVEEVAEEPVIEEPVVEEVAEEPVIEEPVVEEVAEEPVIEEPVVEEVAEEPVIEEPVVEEVAEEPVIEEPVVEEVAEEPVIEEPVVEEVAEEPVIEEPVVEEEETGVEVIDVIWPERRSEHKVYRYDPDGEKVDVGDIVLVPSRDEASKKDIIREAEVARGNYRIDPELLRHPLKKIIRVVRRKAEAVFTAMILSGEESETPAQGAETEE